MIDLLWLFRFGEGTAAGPGGTGPTWFTVAITSTDAEWSGARLEDDGQWTGARLDDYPAI